MKTKREYRATPWETKKSRLQRDLTTGSPKPRPERKGDIVRHWPCRKEATERAECVSLGPIFLGQIVTHGPHECRFTFAESGQKAETYPFLTRKAFEKWLRGLKINYTA